MQTAITGIEKIGITAKKHIGSFYCTLALMIIIFSNQWLKIVEAVKHFWFTNNFEGNFAMESNPTKTNFMTS